MDFTHAFRIFYFEWSLDFEYQEQGSEKPTLPAPVDRVTHTVHSIVTKQEVTSAAGIVALSGIAYWIVREPRDLTVGQMIAFILIVALAFALLVGIYFIYRKNQAWRELPSYLHDINHLYRDVLSSAYHIRNRAEMTDDESIQLEHDVLERVCHKISSIFRLLTGKTCTTTVYLITSSQKAVSSDVCFIWASSELHVERQRHSSVEFELKAGYNTRFLEVLAKLGDKGSSVYFCADVTAKKVKKDYHDSLPNHDAFYKSVICAPIRCSMPIAETPGANQESCLLGFLTIDTSSERRLNGTYHCEFASAFADQMFNFMSLMRKHFRVESAAESRFRSSFEIPQPVASI